jgi:hypothetical protein
MDFLEKKGREPWLNPGGYHPDWDVHDVEFKYEVKLDRKVQETGNVYIEKKSLFNSKSDYLVYLFQRDITPTLFIFIAPSAKVRNHYRRVEREKGLLGGDFKEPGILLGYEEFCEVFRPIGWTLPGASPLGALVH